MADLVGPAPELTFSITIKRADTGLEENYQMVGRVIPQPIKPEKEQDNGCNPLDGGS